MDAIETIEYKGFNINIYYDDDPISPIENWDMFGTMVCWHNRYTLGHEQPKCKSDEWFQQLAMEADPTLEDKIDYWENGIGWRRLSIKYSNFNDNKAFDACEERIKSLIEKAIRKYYVILPLYLYDHSGITISTGSFSCPWDSGQIGYIYISIENILKEFNRKKISKKLRQKAIDLMRGNVNSYDDYLTGSIYGYMVEPTDENKEIKCDDSCWGFYGYDHEKSGLLESAKGSIDYAIAQWKKEVIANHFKRQKIDQFMKSCWAY